MIKTPYYLIDENHLKHNMELMNQVREKSGAKVLLALKCFATWSVFDLMQQYMDGTTSSSLYEVKLGKEYFGKETHAYSVAFSDAEIKEVVLNSDKIIFNSISQLKRFSSQSESIPRGLRINPGYSVSHFLLADPARPFSRLGERDKEQIDSVLSLISGFMFHFNCENDDFEVFSEMLFKIEQDYGVFLSQVDWISLGGGISFTSDAYPLDLFCSRLKSFADKWNVQVYLEPGEASISHTATLEVTVLDIINNHQSIAVVDASIEAHLLDLLVYQEKAQLLPNQGSYAYTIAGKSCLAGDILGEFYFPEPLKIGDRLSILDAAGYTMVKKNWFNGLNMPSIVIRRQNNTLELIKEFTFNDYANSLS